MKKLILFFSLVFLIGCANYSARKDMSQNISFGNTLLPGEYHINIMELKYPKTYSERVAFYKELDTTLKNLNTAQKSSINLLMNKEMKEDFNSLIATKFTTEELIAVKNVKELTPNEIAILNSLKIETPDNAGDVQKLLNRQYYTLLTLTGKEKLYNENYLYTELDKNLLMKTSFTDKSFLIENLIALRQNFVYTEEARTEDFPTLIENTDKMLDDTLYPVVFKVSSIDSGYKVLKDSLLIFVGDGKNISNENSKYRLFSKLHLIDSPKELNNYALLSKTTAVSKVSNWERDSLDRDSRGFISLESRFGAWGEVK